MANTGASLKEENSPKTKIFVVANFLIYWFLLNGEWLFDLSLSWDGAFEKVVTSGSIALLTGMVTTVINGQIDNDLKDILVFKRLKNPLPGSRAFSKYARQDPRIDMHVLHKKCKNLPLQVGKAQNQVWYKIYRKHQTDRSVVDAHRNFLLTRELTGLSAIFLVSFGIASFFLFEDKGLAFSYFMILLMIFFLISNAAKNYGIRLVQNVLAVEAAE
ncbi:MAG: hypothetical protein AAGF93_01400 [Cyanobacteria bacterium P01_H01_bin.105]